MCRIKQVAVATLTAGLSFGPLASIDAMAQAAGATVLSPSLQAVSAPNSPGGYAPPDQPVPEGISVASRPRADYLPIGGRIGSFFLYPELTVSGRYTDNVRANDAVKFGDGSVRAAGGAQVVSGFGRHELRAGGWFNRTFFLNHSDENASQYGGAVAGRADLPGTTVWLKGTAERRVLPREDFNSPGNSRSPLSYNRLEGSVDVERKIARFSVGAGASVARLSYLNVVDDSGALLDQRWRDVSGSNFHGELGYALNPAFRIIARGEYNLMSYALPASDPAQPGGLDRDSHGWRMEGGVRVSLSRVVVGELRIGYLERTYDDPRLLATRGLSFHGDLLWNVTSLTSVRFNADRRIEEAASTTAAGNRVTEFGVSVEHELMRNLIVTASGRHLHYQPLGPTLAGDDWVGRVGARWLINRRFTGTLEYRRSSRDMSDITRDFVQNAVTAGITLML